MVCFLSKDGGQNRNILWQSYNQLSEAEAAFSGAQERSEHSADLALAGAASRSARDGGLFWLLCVGVSEKESRAGGAEFDALADPGSARAHCVGRSLL